MELSLVVPAKWLDSVQSVTNEERWRSYLNGDLDGLRLEDALDLHQEVWYVVLLDNEQLVGPELSLPGQGTAVVGTLIDWNETESGGGGQRVATSSLVPSPTQMKSMMSYTWPRCQ